MDNNTIIDGTVAGGTFKPFGIVVFETDTDSLVMTDPNNNRIVGLWHVGASSQNISVVATQWAPGQSLCSPYNLYVDVTHEYNMYVSDNCNNQVILYTNMQSISPLPFVIAGSVNGGGPPLAQVHAPYGIYVDKHSNMIVASSSDHRIMFWSPNATNGVVIAGLGTPDGTSMGLNRPWGIALDELNSWLYVADYNNHRIQRYSINDSWPCNGTTVAGGNGPGSGSHQLYAPTDVSFSKKTGALYIVDNGNSRIQRWDLGATQGVTIAGNPNGNEGQSDTELCWPVGLAINANETYMYVTDEYNNRVQRFQLI